MKDNTNQISNKKSSKTLIAVLLSVGVFVLIGIAGVSAFLIGKNTCQKCNSTNTLETDTSSTEDTQDGTLINHWIKYTDRDGRISFEYPSS